ncbi:hypothetical protein SAMN04487928_1249 [Butyrivibrio proteoclasticus]|uniref:CRESS-DNA virus Rep endonuclease domain-containing protein n=1 Tax=Butyrivibrio proteoclasticus TaxID=43305 RepID=A0A1I5WPN8_9FIRM|nr:hypothetical protein [Butyrivibrio proteoclasticus]SFQ21356.1 hypothetical protein SAMN04487928_1249 [Butyrivibrio proteoclasticus]
MPETKPKTDTQSRSYSLCFHNLEDTGYTHEKIMQILQSIPSIKYCCLAEEIGVESKKLHAHAYFYSSSPIRFSTLRNKFFDADVNIQKSQGTAEENRSYCFKVGKWENDPKSDQRINGRQWEYGQLPENHKGQRTDLEQLYQLIKEGFSNSEILEAMPDIALRNIDKLDKVRLSLFYDKYSKERRLDLTTHYIYGITGGGKTRGILDMHGDESVYRVTDYAHPFDSYDPTRHSVIVFDEFRSSLKLQDMLSYLDVYAVLLPARYSNKVAAYTTAYVVSNEPFESQYADIQKVPDKAETYAAWVRRFNGYVKRYNADGTIDTWDTMKEYLDRNKSWHTPEATDNLPFE